ncbi:MAG: glycoside hydrolase family 11 protein [Flavisolibacter sp.]
MKKKILLRATMQLCFLFCMFNVFSQTITQNQTGKHDGFYYSFWSDGSTGTASITLKEKGRYQAKWTKIGNFTAGKGWSIGKENRIVCYSGEFDGGTNGYLALYGWTKDSLIEYYVVENYGHWTPPGAISLGSFESDGGTYNIYKTRRINQPSIVGTASFSQFWSVRTTKRTNGTITFKNHVNAWKRKGMYLGKTWDYQIMETEGYKSSGSSDITVSECASKQQ